MLTTNYEDAILEIPETATTQQIRDAYKRYTFTPVF
jgi:DnaJ-class molecular chaperone